MIASLILLLHLSGALTLENAVISLYVAGFFLIAAEIAVVSFGLIALNGALALYAAFALQMNHESMLGLDMGWPVLLGITFVEIFVIIAIIFIHMRIRRIKRSVGTESMIGDQATVITWKGKKGTVRYEGEIWKASSEKALDLNADDKVTIDKVEKLNLSISAT